ncbi:MAG: hydrogenase [Verrucomicrobiota bacterium]|jgi:hypothetical protein|nr:hydrogenase [Verrucomicrobiota bacterium]
MKAPFVMMAMLETTHGGWSPLVWLVVFAAACGVALWIRAIGRGDSRTGGASQKPFLSGNDLADPEDARVAASNMYWGFTHALRVYYRRVMAFHSGSLADSILWFLVVLAMLLLAGRVA